MINKFLYNRILRQMKINVIIDQVKRKNAFKAIYNRLWNGINIINQVKRLSGEGDSSQVQV